MSDEPNFDFLPWEQLSIGVRRNRKKMYNYIVSVLNGDTPEPSTTGTVTVTTVDSEDTPLENSMVYLLTAPTLSADNIVGVGRTDDTGTTLIYEYDPEEGGPSTVVKQVTFGDYYLRAQKGMMSLMYTGSLTVDGNEEVTITLTPP